MGRPKELTEEERAKLLADGFRPVEVWVLDTSLPEVRQRIESEAKAIRASDQRTGEIDRLSDLVDDLWDDFRP